jgi:imidazolonepropionase-like amidohydrolase
LPSAPTVGPVNELLIDDVQVFDSVAGTLRAGPVHVVDGVVAAVGTPVRDRHGLTVLDGQGGTAIPGLIDAHFHAYAVALDVPGLEARSLSYVALAAADRLGRALRRGFTTVRDVAGGDPGLAAAIADDLLVSPRYLYTGPALSQTGGHGDPRAPEDTGCGCGGINVEVVDGPDALRVAVRDRFRRGAHAIKVMASGGVLSENDPIRVPQYSAEEIRVVADEARRRGSYVAAHAYSVEAIRHAVENGVRSVEHGNLLDAATAELMASRDAVLVPTLAAYDAIDRLGADAGISAVSRAKNAEVLDAGRRAVELAHAAGVQVGFGTDLLGVLESEQLSGLRLHVELDGVVRTLQSATLVNARLIGRPDLGVIEPGSAGDIVVLPGDVLDDPGLLWGPRRTVVHGGVVQHSGHDPSTR